MIHELSHGYMADFLGDPTARLAGRLTINPLAHIDLWGSIIVPIITYLMGFTFGWAKPVPYNPYNLKNKRSGELLIALAGPVSNIVVAVVFGLIIRFAVYYPSSIFGTFFGSTNFVEILMYIVVINISLAIFNLVPLPPLDGSKILFSIFPHQYGRLRMTLERYGFIFVLIAVFFLWQFIAPVIPWVFHLITGVAV